MLTVHSAHMLTTRASGMSGFKLLSSCSCLSAFTHCPCPSALPRSPPQLPLSLETQLQLQLLQEVFSNPVAP